MLLVEYLNILGYLSLLTGKHLLQYLTESIGRICVDGDNKMFRNLILFTNKETMRSNNDCIFINIAVKS